MKYANLSPMLTPFTQRAISVIRQIPKGKVLTYGGVSDMAGTPGKARQVAWLLHSMSQKHDLPWHRVINARGKISLPVGNGYEIQKRLLEAEGIRFSDTDVINLSTYLWVPLPADPL